MLCLPRRNKDALRAMITCVPAVQMLKSWLDRVCSGEIRVPGKGPFYNTILLDLLPYLQGLVPVDEAARHVPFRYRGLH